MKKLMVLFFASFGRSCLRLSCYRTSRKMQPELDRGYVQRVRVTRLAGREVALFDVRTPGETVYLVCAGGLGIGVVDGEQRARLREAMREAASPGDRTQLLWRARFEGASLTRVGLRAVELARKGRALRAESGRDDGVLLAEGAMNETEAAPRAVLEQRGAAIADELASLGTSGHRDALRRALGKAIARVGRRVAAVEGDLGRIEGADALAARAQLFVPAAASAPRGADRLCAVDWASGDAEAVELPIDPAREAMEQIDALFRRARRLKEGARIGRQRLAEAKVSLASLHAALSALAAADADLPSLETRARAAAPRDFKGTQSGASGGRHRPDAPRPPYRMFLGGSGARILVGRGAAHNDALTMRIARPHDLWLHAKGSSGAHVIVALEKGASCPPDLLVEAAHLAAHFSDARDERVVDVQYTPRRYLRKPRGSPPGLVVVDREKVIILRKDDQVLRGLLEAEVV